MIAPEVSPWDQYQFAISNVRASRPYLNDAVYGIYRDMGVTCVRGHRPLLNADHNMTSIGEAGNYFGKDPAATGTAWSDGHLFLGLDTGGAWSALRADDRWSDGPPLFPCFEGFFLGCSESEPAARAGLVVPVIDRRFSSVDLALMSVSVPDDGSDWWTEVHWQIDDRRPLRGKRSA